MSETELSEIKININFENLIPKQTAEQFKQLEENMIAEGRARNPLVLWSGHGTLVDGHHRLRVLKAHPELKWSVIWQDFAGEDEVKEWIIKNALGTRNLTEMQITELRGRLLKTMKGHRGATKGNARAERDESGKFTVKSEKATSRSGDVAAQIAKDLGINRNTVYEAANFVDGLDKAETAVPGFKNAVLTGEVKATKQEVAAMRKQSPEEIKQNVEAIKERKSKKNKATDKAFFGKLKEIYAEASGVTTTQYGLAELVREVDALGNSFIESLSAIIKRRQAIIDTYDGQEDIDDCINSIIEKLNEMKGK